MGRSNYRHALETKFAALTGELREVYANIERIRREHEKLRDLEAGVPKLQALIESVSMLLTENNPDWKPEQIVPVRPWTHTLPVPFGSCGRRGMEVLRQASEPMTTRQIAMEVLRQSGNDQADSKTIQRTLNAIEASLRKHRGRSVESSGKYPAQWRSIIKPEIGFDP